MSSWYFTQMCSMPRLSAAQDTVRADVHPQKRLNKTAPELTRGTGTDAPAGILSNCEYLPEISFGLVLGSVLSFLTDLNGPLWSLKFLEPYLAFQYSDCVVQ